MAETLAADPDVRVVEELALWATPDTAARLAGHPHADVRSAVAANEATPPAVLAALVSGEGLPPARRCRVCDREKIPFVHDPHCSRIGCDLLPGAACDGSHESTVHEMRLRALRNPALPAETAVGFVSHPSMPLRRQLAAREDLPPWAYQRLADDPIPGVRSELAANPAVDVALLLTLAADQDRDVRRALAHHPDVPLDVLAELARGTRLGSPLLPRIVAASPTEVRELAESPEPLLRMLVARRRDLPPEVRDALAADADAKVAKSIAPHPGLSEAGLRSMVDRHGAQVIAKVATNPDATPELLEDLARHRPPVRKSFREIARHPNATGAALLACLSDRQARPIAAGHPALPISAMTELLTDDDWRTAEAAAANASLPLAAMAALVSRGPNEDPCA
ncbi:hypothetical protein [Actinocorallia populi]|uniref:hypothetical protein n=1 Tax=Actinocorallia populi TaxID=2079200 RepID=UPI0013001C57|nr:hypothetical protein [Actinocorallia populi]